MRIRTKVRMHYSQGNIFHSHDSICCKSLASIPVLTVTVTVKSLQTSPAVAIGTAKFESERN